MPGTSGPTTMKTSLKLASALLALFAISSAASAQDGDPEKGKKVFKKCKICHSVGPGAKRKIGPPLNDIIGATAGVQKRYKYSKAMKMAGKKGFVWTEDKLKAYLEKPRKVVPGGKMSFPGLRKEADRDDVVAFLKTFTKKK